MNGTLNSMLIYSDCDGTLNEPPKKLRKILKKLPQPLYGLFSFLLRGQSRREVIKTLREVEEEGLGIIIITARFKVLKGRLKCWLKDNQVPYTELICTGPFWRMRKKRKIIEEKGIRIGLDNETNIGRKGGLEIISPDNHRRLLEKFKIQVVV